MRRSRWMGPSARSVWLLACGAWLAACGGSAGDRDAPEAPVSIEPRAPAAAPARDEGVAGVGSGRADDEANDGQAVDGREAATPDEPYDGSQAVSGPLCTASNEIEGYFIARTQADIDAFAGCEVIHGTLAVSYDADTNLAALASLRVVDESLLLAAVTDYSGAPQPSVRIPSLSAFAGLQHVRQLAVANAEGGLGQFASLQGEVESLSLSDLPGVTDLHGLDDVVVTRELAADNMPDLVSLEGVAITPELDNVRLTGLPQLKNLASLAGLQRLRSLLARDMPSLSQLSLPSSLTQLEAADFYDVPALTSLADLSRLSGIADLRVGNAPLLTDLGGGGSDTGSLQSLYLQSCPLLSSLAPAGGLSNVAGVYITSCNGLTHLDELAESSELTVLELRDNDGLVRLPVFANAGSTMEAIRINGNAVLVEGPQFPNLRALYQFDAFNYQHAELEISDNPRLASVSLPLLESASMVTIVNDTLLDSVSLPSLATLKWLRVVTNGQLTTLELNVQSELRSIELDTNPVLEDVRLGTPALPLDLLTLRGNPGLSPDVRQLLLDLVYDRTQLTLD